MSEKSQVQLLMEDNARIQREAQTINFIRKSKLDALSYAIEMKATDPLKQAKEIYEWLIADLGVE